jgi:heptosyltransferase-1
LRERSFDLVIDAQGLLKSAFLARLTSAPQRIGFDSKEPTGWLLTQRLPKDLGPRIGSEYLGMARALALDVGTFDMDIALTDADRQFAVDIAEGREFFVLAPFTTRPQKHWPETHWRDLVLTLSNQGKRILVLGGPADTEAAERLIADSSAQSFAGRASLTQSAALVSAASGLIGVDTGLTHMGIAFNTPTVALFGSTCPYTDATRSNAEVIYHGLECSPCRRNPTCDGRFDCMRGITADEASEVLARVIRHG